MVYNVYIIEHDRTGFYHAYTMLGYNPLLYNCCQGNGANGAEAASVLLQDAELLGVSGAAPDSWELIMVGDELPIFLSFLPKETVFDCKKKTCCFISPWFFGKHHTYFTLLYL